MSNGDKRVVIVGGGVAGLAAAYDLMEAGGFEPLVLEASGRPGGTLRTEITDDGYVIEHGPDAILTEKPAAMRLAERVGLSDEVVSTNSKYRGAYVVCDGKLEMLPEGFALMAPTSLRPFVKTRILSWRGKARAALDLLLPRGGEEDESLASFVERRFGRELLERLAQPMVGGIYGADPQRLSLRATMPRFLETERKHRSVMLGLRRGARARMKAAKKKGGGKEAGARYGLFASFRQGVEMLPKAVAAALGDRVRTNAPVERVEPREGGWTVHLAGGEQLEADAVVLATAAWRSAEMLRGTDAELAGMLEAIPYGSAATVTFAWPVEQIPRPLDAFGFVVPMVENRVTLAATFASVKWPSRAPEGKELIRVFLGGPGRDDIVDWDDEALVHAARSELGQLMGIEAEPELLRIDRYRKAMPRYELGHLDRIDAIEQRTASHPGLHLAGNGYRGVGIPDSILSGQKAAAAIAGTDGD